MADIHIYVHGTRTRDAGTSEGARKAAITRKQHGAYKVGTHSSLGINEGGSHQYHVDFHQQTGPGGTVFKNQHRGTITYQTAAEAEKAGHEWAKKNKHKFHPGPASVKGRDGSVEETMQEYKKGQLHSGSSKGPKVKSRKQAIAIALNQAGKSNK